ncbi:MAG: hypothetical protein QM724_08395 [Flavobacteriales bacterium]
MSERHLLHGIHDEQRPFRSSGRKLLRSVCGLLVLGSALLNAPMALAQAATLNPGDIAIVGMAACPLGTNDQISFFCFKDITVNTVIDLTDNGYERCYAGKFGNTEGTVRLVRKTSTILAGRVITLKLSSTGLPTATAPDANWTISSLNGSTNYLSFNNNGDQLIFMQGGTWNSGTVNGNDATYANGRFLAAFSSNPDYPWSASCPTVTNSSSSGSSRSNAPPGTGCLALQPLSATAWNKYIGDTAIATQKEWLLRIANPANWQGYVDCSAYTTAGINWPSLTTRLRIKPPDPMTNGLWTGAQNTDWFNQCNWDDLSVPIITSDVQIDQGAANVCVIGPSVLVPTTTAARCKTLTITSNTVVNNTLTISNDRTLNVTGQMLVTKASPGTGSVGATLSGGKVVCGSLIIDGTTAGTQNGFYRSESSLDTTTVSGNVTIETGGLLDLQPTSGTGGVLRVGGNWTNNDAEAAFQEVGSTVQFNGATSDQTLNTVDTRERFHNLTMNKPAFDLVLNDSVTMGGALLLTKGRITVPTPYAFTVEAGGSLPSPGTDASHVNGPMRKTGNTAFDFPIGKGGEWRPIGISGITASSTYTAEYFPQSARTTFGTATDGTLDHVSDCEYWTLAPSGASTAVVKMWWDTPNSCGVDAPVNLRIANWSSSQWNDRGNTATSPMGATGSLSTPSAQSTFGPFTLASVSANNPLPIQLLHFGAVPDGREVALDWTTTTEKDNAYFTVERSSDAWVFTELLRMPGAGNSQKVLHYTTRDPTRSQALATTACAKPITTAPARSALSCPW